MMKNLNLLFVLAIISALIACSNDDDNGVTPESTDRGVLVANRLILNVTNINGPAFNQSFEFYDPDGAGGADPTINEKIVLDYNATTGNTTFNFNLRFFQNQQEITADIEQAKESYIICHRDYNFNNIVLTDFDIDSDSLKVGLNTEWRAKNNPNEILDGEMRITLKYLSKEKTGLCDAGVRIMTANMNYELQR